MMETETIDKLFLELSQVTRATTGKELALEANVKILREEIRRMRYRIESLRGGLKSASGWLLDANDIEGSEKCLEMAGDMEPPLT